MNARERRRSGGARPPSFRERSGSARPAPNASAERRGGPGESAFAGDISRKERSPTRRETKAQTQEVWRPACRRFRSIPTRPGCGSTASSSRASRLAFTHIRRDSPKGRASPSTQAGEDPSDRLERPVRACASRRSRLDAAEGGGPEARRPRPATTAASSSSITLHEGQRRPRPQQACRPRRQGRSGTRAMSTACSRRCATRRARSRASSTASTRTPPAVLSSQRRALPPWRSARPSARARRARSTGPSSPACRGCGRAGFDLSRQGGDRRQGRAHARRRARRRGREPRAHLLRRRRHGGPEARLAVAEARYWAHPPAARPRRPYRPSDRRRPEILRRRELGAAGRPPEQLHLLARRIVIPHPRTGRPIDVTAPLPPHMEQSFNLLGFDAARYDPIVEAPEA